MAAAAGRVGTFFDAIIVPPAALGEGFVAVAGDFLEAASSGAALAGFTGFAAFAADAAGLAGRAVFLAGLLFGAYLAT
jgi:hypothetical protein